MRDCSRKFLEKHNPPVSCDAGLPEGGQGQGDTSTLQKKGEGASAKGPGLNYPAGMIFSLLRTYIIV